MTQTPDAIGESRGQVDGDGLAQVLVSVVVPVYNRAGLVGQAIESVLAQTVQNYEIVAVDDGSVDASLSILRECELRFPGRIRVLAQRNSGPSVARNAAIVAAKGRYIAFLDSDDLWAPEKLERQLSLLRKHKDIAFVYSGYCLIDQTGLLIEERRPNPDFQGNLHGRLWSGLDGISGGTLMVERNRLIEVGLFDTALGGAENLDLRMRLSALGNVYYDEDILYYYRIHKDSLTARPADMDKYHVLLLEKHLGKNGERNRRLWRSIRSRQLFVRGGELLADGEYANAAGTLLRSIRLNPFRPVAYLNVFRCLLGARFNRWLSSQKRRLLSRASTTAGKPGL